MGVYIPKMDMPTACMKDCPFQYFGDCYGGKIKRIMDVEDYEDKRHPRCPLIEVPTPHGRLIDEEWLFSFISTNNSLGATHYGCLTKEEISYAPTVIEREE